MSEEELEKDDGEYITASEANELKKPEVWQMPQPVFRQTSGYLPQGFEKQAAPAEHAPPPPSEAEADAPQPTEIAVEPQPYVSEEFTQADLTPQPPPKTGSKTGLPIVLMVVALGAILAFAIGFAVLIYFFLFARGGETSF